MRACEVQAAGELAYGRDFALLLLSTSTCLEDHAGVVFHRRDHHPAPVFGLLRGTSQVLPVHGDRRMCRAVLAGPLTDGVVQGLGRQRGEDVVEGGDCGRGVALLARAPERTHCLELLLGEQGRRTGRTRSPLGSRPDGPRRREPEWCSAGSACPGHGGTRAPRPDTRTGCAAAAPPLARCVAQRSSVPAPRSGSAPRRRRRSVRTRRSPWAGRGGASAPSLRARGQSRGSAPASASSTRGSRSRQSARHPRTSPPERRDIHAPPGCPATAAAGSAPAPGRPSCAPGQASG